MSPTLTNLTPAEHAAKIINQTNRHVFLTGKAGTGKTTFLKRIIDQTHKKTIIVAPTGIAAINAGGVTIHSQFQLPIGPFLPTREPIKNDALALKFNTMETLFKQMRMSNNKRKVLREIELLIIDEVSMLRADVLDAVDGVLRFVRQNGKAFGGVQVLFIGDLHQLPPVVRVEEWQLLSKYYNNMMFFEAHVLKKEQPLYVELDKIYRQNDIEFISLLNNLRHNEITDADISLLNKHFDPSFDIGKHKNTIYLTTHNYKADSKNKQALNSLPGRPFVFDAEIKGEFNEFSYPTDPKLELKAGAQIMFIKNDPLGHQRFFNGRIATVKSVNTNEIIVQFEEPWDTLKLEKYEWQNIRFEHNSDLGEIEENIIGTFKQYPIKLAWAITVHKSQGLTFERAVLDINESFAPGQIYVALSRLKSLDGLVLTNPFKRKKLEQDETLNHFEKIKDRQGDLETIIKSETKEFIKGNLQLAFALGDIFRVLKSHAESYVIAEGQVSKKRHSEWATMLANDFESYKNVSEVFLKEISTILSKEEGGILEHLLTRIKSAQRYFLPTLTNYSERIYHHRLNVRSEKKVKTYLKELEEVESMFPKKIREMAKAVLLIESIIENKELNRSVLNEMLNKSGSVLQRRNVEAEDEGEEEEYDLSKRKSKKADSKNTKKITLDLFKQGLSVEEIAEVRGLTTATIEGHLAHFVGTGVLELEAVMSKEKALKIIEIAEGMEEALLKDVKEKLGDEFSYSNIKYANAYKKVKARVS